MLNDHSKVGIALIIFYIPAVALAAYLLFLRHGRPRMAWYLLTVFSLVRVASGIVVILFENNPSVGLTIAAIALLSVGVVPLFLATLGLLRILLAMDFERKHLLHRLALYTRLLFPIGIALLVAGSVFVGNYNSASSVARGLKLVKAGNIVIAAILVILVAFQAYLWSQKTRLSGASVTIIKGTASATPFLIIRIVYALLSVFATGLKWNNLYGSIAAFVCMELLMEYVVVGIYISVGLAIPRIGSEKLIHPGSSVVLPDA